MARKKKPVVVEETEDDFGSPAHIVALRSLDIMRKYNLNRDSLGAILKFFRAYTNRRSDAGRDMNDFFDDINYCEQDIEGVLDVISSLSAVLDGETENTREMLVELLMGVKFRSDSTIAPFGDMDEEFDVFESGRRDAIERGLAGEY